jgi:hypothetical protein
MLILRLGSDVSKSRRHFVSRGENLRVPMEEEHVLDEHRPSLGNFNNNPDTRECNRYGGGEL